MAHENGGPVLLIHGGAGDITVDNTDQPRTRQALLAALDAGWAALVQGAGALAAVESAVLSLEDSGCFSAGKGATHDSEGQITLDAALMDGSTRAAGAIAAVPGLKNPIAGARLVMERTPHVLMVGAGAEAFLRAQNARFEPAPYFEPAHATVAPKHGTVGAVAVDAAGNTAAATSTGGTRNKLPGRVGDSPLIGSGTYADGGAAVSATGLGEAFIRTVFGHRVAVAIEGGAPAQTAVERALAHVTQVGGTGGGIAVSRSGDWGASFTTQGMFRAVRTAQGLRQAAIFAGETLGSMPTRTRG